MSWTNPGRYAAGKLLKPGCSIQTWGQQINRHRQESGGVSFAGDFPHGLEEAQLQRDRLFADHRGRLHHLLGGLKLAFGVDDL
jgi:hypothetical protein